MRILSPGLLGLLLLALFAGCADGSEPSTDDGPKVDATSTTGGIRGVVVDESIVPIPGVTVRVQDTALVVATDADGQFLFSGLEPGTYFVEASHPFYTSGQTSTVVEAGVKSPPALRIQLVRQIFDEPRMIPFVFEGYIFCSANVPIGYSEECGEGVGSPESTCSIPRALLGSCYGLPDVANPVLPGERIGRNPSNAPGQEWYVDAPYMQTMIVEQHWTPSLEISASGGGKFRTFVGENWVCDPFCGSDYSFGNYVSGSPLYARIDMDKHSSFSYNETTRFTTFTYAADNPGVLLEQPYQLFVHTFHVLPAPEGWSIVNGDTDPFGS